MIADLFRRSSPESPTTNLAQAASWLLEALGGGPTHAGVSVGPKSALKHSAFWACVRVVSEDLATLSCHLYERGKERGKRRAPEHPIYRLIHEQPNPNMNAVTYFETAEAHRQVWGNAYSEIEFDDRGEVKALWPLRPDVTHPAVVNGERYYVTQVADDNGNATKLVALPASRVLHVPGLGFDGYQGYSVAAMAKQALGLALAAEEYGARFFGNGAHMGVIVTFPGAFRDPAIRDRVKEGVEVISQGLRNAHRVAVLEDGAKVERLGMSQEDAQFLETRRFQVEEIARFFRVPPHKIGHLERMTFNNVEELSIDYVRSAIRPAAKRWEQAMTLKLLHPRDRGKFFIEFELDSLLRGNTQVQTESFKAGTGGAGWMMINDIRETMNLPLLPPEIGDVLYVPMNMAPADALREMLLSKGGQKAADSTGRARLAAAAERTLAGVLARSLRREARVLERAAARAGATPESFRAEAERLYREEIGPGLHRDLELVEQAFGGDLLAEGWRDGCAARYVEGALEQLADVVAGEDFAARLARRLESWNETRAAVVARLELADLDPTQTKESAA